MTAAGPHDPFFDEPGADDDYEDWTWRGVACSVLLVVAFLLVFVAGCAPERPTGLRVRRTDGRVVAVVNGEQVAEAPRHGLRCAHERAVSRDGVRSCPDCWWRVHPRRPK